MSKRCPPGLSFVQALTRLRRGAVLNLEHVRSKPVWTLDSRDVAPEVITLLIDGGEIEPAGDALFDDGLSQTWRLQSHPEPADSGDANQGVKVR